MVERRYNMDNQERIARILKHLRESRDYRTSVYNAYKWMGWTLLFSLCYYSSTNDIKGVIIIILFMLSVFLVLNRIIAKKRFGSVMESLECDVNVKEMVIIPPGTRAPRLASYQLIGYYVDGLKTYRFHTKVKDDQWDLYRIMIRIRNEGEFPKIKVLVDSHNYKNYKIMGYEFVEDTIYLNRQLVEDELNRYYAA